MACSNGRNFMEARSMLRITEQAPGRHVTDSCSSIATTGTITEKEGEIERWRKKVCWVCIWMPNNNSNHR